LIYILIAIPDRASAKPCKQGNTHPVVILNVQVKGGQKKGACKFNQISNSCLPTMVQPWPTMVQLRLQMCANHVQSCLFSFFIQKQHCLATCQPEPTMGPQYPLHKDMQHTPRMTQFQVHPGCHCIWIVSTVGLKSSEKNSIFGQIGSPLLLNG
jgi:hypothetical protein